MKRLHPKLSILDGSCCMIGDSFAFSEMIDGELQGPVLFKDMNLDDLEDVKEHLLISRRNAIQVVENIKQTQDIPIEMSIEKILEFLEGEVKDIFKGAVMLYSYTEKYYSSVLEALK